MVTFRGGWSGSADGKQKNPNAGTELNEVPNQSGPYARCTLDKTMAWARGGVGFRHATGVWQGNRLSVAAGPVSRATQ